jgi:magnesium-transporting ATPase (P-type)
MVTGDNKITAMAIAKECNIIDASMPTEDAGDVVMLGPDFYARVEGLKCKKCKQKSQNCTCKSPDECVGNL